MSVQKRSLTTQEIRTECPSGAMTCVRCLEDTKINPARVCSQASSGMIHSLIHSLTLPHLSAGLAPSPAELWGVKQPLCDQTIRMACGESSRGGARVRRAEARLLVNRV